MNDLILTFIIVCPLIFIASFVDAVAGGGGLISLPAYLLAGLSPHMAMGTNKVVSPMGTLVAAINYLKGGKVNLQVGLIAALGAIVGASCGGKLALYLPENVLKIVILVALPVVAVLLATQKDFGADDAEAKSYSGSRMVIYAMLIGIVMGFYDGLIGPGTGTFMIIAFTKVFGLDLVTSSGCAKVANLASNVGAAIVFILAGKIEWIIVLPAVVCSVAGGKCGALYAMKGGSKRVRQIIYVVLALLAIKFLTELL